MEHFYHSLDGWFDYHELYSHMVDSTPDNGRFVEVGSHDGRSAAYLAVEIINSGKDIRLTCVDPSGRYSSNLGPVSHVVEFMQQPSPDAADRFDDLSLDFVWIDADHSEDAFRADVVAWLPKLKTGGYIGGHDYDHPQHPGIAVVCHELLPGHEEWKPHQPGGMVTSFLWRKPAE